MKVSISLIFCLLLMSSLSFAKLENLFDEHTTIAKPFSLRDPFEGPKFKSESKERRDNRVSGIRDDEPKLATDVDLNNLNITGVLIGKERRVLIDVGGKVYKFKEEEFLGPNGPRIKAILPGGIILVEQITNIYGEAEYIETVIPIFK